MRPYFFQSLKLSIVILALCSILYPLLIAGIATTAPGGGNGQTLSANGKVVGYENIGQEFTDDQYFQGRPSAVNYNAAGSGGSNKGASNAEYLAVVQARIDTFLAHNPGVSKSEIPADLVTASGSGLDPHISVKAAEIKVSRIAKARNIPVGAVRQCIDQHTRQPLLGMFGTSTVHVLQLNLSLNRLTRK